MTTKTRRGMRRRKRMEFRLVLAAVFCLLATAGITMYLLELRRFCRRPMEGGVSYALR